MKTLLLHCSANCSEGEVLTKKNYNNFIPSLKRSAHFLHSEKYGFEKQFFVKKWIFMGDKRGEI